MSNTVSAPPLHEGSPYARHIPALDGIRGLAILGVAASHLFPGNTGSGFTSYLGRLMAFGAGGVDLFFVLSGFLITGILYDSLGDPAFFQKFYARRVLRIFPLYYGVLAVYGVAAIVLGLNFQGELLSFALYLQNTHLVALPIYTYTGSPALPLGHFWSLAVEEQFYLIWPLLVFLVRDRVRLLWVCVAFFFFCPILRVLLTLHGTPYLVVHTNTLCNADLLLAGAALALWVRGPEHDRALSTGPWLLVAGLILPRTLYMIDAHTPLASNLALMNGLGIAFDVTGLALASFGLVAMSLRGGPTRKMFSVRPLRLLGKYSYGIYVFHLILFSYLQQPLKHEIAMHLTSNRAVAVVLAGLLSFAFTLVCAYLSYQLFEKHFLRLKRFFDYRERAVAPATHA